MYIIFFFIDPHKLIDEYEIIILNSMKAKEVLLRRS